MRVILSIMFTLLITSGVEANTNRDQLFPPLISSNTVDVKHVSTHKHTQHLKKVVKRHYNIAPITGPVGPIIPVETAAGITIQVADSLADKFKGFIKDLVEVMNYTPKQIHCFAKSGHVAHSRHYVGAACDFDQRGWGLTAPTMHHVASLAHKWGLRDGCEFKDCGHIDDGRVPSRLAAKHWPLMYRELGKGG